jgi:ribonuclease HI
MYRLAKTDVNRHPTCVASGVMYSFSIRLSAPCTNNLAEYEAVRRGVELLFEAEAEAIEVFGDSKLVISQLMQEYRCESESLFPLWMQYRELVTQFRYINFYWIPRSQNAEANDLAQKASEYKAITDKADFPVQFLETGGWRADIFNYLKDPARGGGGTCDRTPSEMRGPSSRIRIG